MKKPMTEPDYARIISGGIYWIGFIGLAIVNWEIALFVFLMILGSAGYNDKRLQGDKYD